MGPIKDPAATIGPLNNPRRRADSITAKSVGIQINVKICTRHAIGRSEVPESIRKLI